MYWYDETGKESDVVVSSRIRFARNITDKPFMSRLNLSLIHIQMCIRDSLYTYQKNYYTKKAHCICAYQGLT